MRTYILRRLFVMIPTLLGVTMIVFGIINLAPGSPIEQKIQQLKFGGTGGGESTGGFSGSSRDSAISEEVIDALKKQYGFDQPVLCATQCCCHALDKPSDHP